MPTIRETILATPQTLLSALPATALRGEGSCQSNLVEAGGAVAWPWRMAKRSPFRHFRTSPEVISLAVMLYINQERALYSRQNFMLNRATALAGWRSLFCCPSGARAGQTETIAHSSDTTAHGSPAARVAQDLGGVSPGSHPLPSPVNSP